MVSVNQIKAGISRGVIQFIKDPNMESGTVCMIGDGWFYFGGLTAEEENPEEYLKNASIDDIAFNIYEVLNDFRRQEDFSDEYLYYESILKEAGI